MIFKRSFKNIYIVKTKWNKSIKRSLTIKSALLGKNQVPPDVAGPAFYLFFISLCFPLVAQKRFNTCKI
jgi:hypothetical protein